MFRRAEYRRLVSGLEPHIDSFNSQWNRAFPSADGGTYLFKLGRRDGIIYFLDCLPSSQPFLGYQPLPQTRDPSSFTTTSSLPTYYTSNEQDSLHKNSRLRLHCILGGLVLQPPRKAPYRTPFLVTKGFGDLQKDWCFWIWWNHNIQTPPENRKGLLFKQYVSCVKLGDIGPDRDLPIDIQYVQGFISGVPHLVDASSQVCITLEDMETFPAEVPKSFGIDVILDRLGKIDEHATYKDLEEVKNWFTLGHAADLKDVKVELNNTTIFLDVNWDKNNSSFIVPIDHYSLRPNQERPYGATPKVSERPPPNTAFTLNSNNRSWLVVSLGVGSAGVEGVYKPELGYVLWAPELKTFLVICEYCNMSGEGELDLLVHERVGMIELPIHSEACMIKEEIKYSVLKLDFSAADTNRATLEVLTDKGYELTVVDMEGGRMRKVASTTWVEKA